MSLKLKGAATFSLQGVAVLGIALIAMGEEIGAEMALRTFGHLVSIVWRDRNILFLVAWGAPEENSLMDFSMEKWSFIFLWMIMFPTLHFIYHSIIGTKAVQLSCIIFFYSSTSS